MVRFFLGVAVLFFHTQVASADVNTRVNTLVHKLDSMQRYGADTYSFGPALFVEGCRSYPHYSSLSGQNRNGHLRLKHDLKLAISRGLKCVLNLEMKFQTNHRRKVLKLLEYLEDPSLRKTYACIPGIDGGAYAYSNYENYDVSSPDFMSVRDLIPAFPGMILDTNSIANNRNLFVPSSIHPLTLDQIHPGFEKNAYNRLLYRGFPDQESSPYEATEMLLFHEMLHWAGFRHRQNGHMDEVRLIQSACFGLNIFSKKQEPSIQQKALRILQDEDYWSLPPQEKNVYAVANEYHLDMYDILEHTYYPDSAYKELPKIPDTMQTKKIQGINVYGVTANLSALEKVLNQIASSEDLYNMIIKPFLSTNSILFTSKKKGADETATVVMPVVQFGALPAMSHNLKKQQMYSGEERFEDFGKLRTRFINDVSEYFSSVIDVQHQIPFDDLSLKSWSVGVFFDPEETRMDSLNIGGDLYTSEELIFYYLWYSSQLIKDDGFTQEPSSNVLNFLLSIYSGPQEL